jgi:hypothetical protein
LDKFDEIVLVDYQNWSYNKFYGRTYLVKLTERPIKLYGLNILTGMELLEQLKTKDYKKWEKINSIIQNRKDDSILDSIQRYNDEIKKLKNEYRPVPDTLKELDVQTIEGLKREIVKNVSREQILAELGITKESIDKHLDDYLLKYLDEEKVKYKPKKLNYCKEKLNDFDLFKKMAMSITHGGATEDYPTVSVEFRNNNDTLKYYTTGQHSFMLPWLDNKGKEYSYNPSLSKEIAKLLPGFKYSNRERLLGQPSMYGDYVTELYFRTIELYCIDKKNKLIAQ